MTPPCITQPQRGRAMRRAAAVAMLTGAGIVAGSTALAAQVWTPGSPREGSSTWRPELRADWFGGRASALHAGAGVSARAGNYLRIGLNAGGGAALSDSSRNVAHADVTARFMLDPFRMQRVGVSLGGGVGARYEHDRVRAFALVFVDAEAGQERRWTPFIRAGVGGGVRVTAGVRRASGRFR